MPENTQRKTAQSYPLELKQQAVQMLQDGHSATLIASRLGLPRTNLIYKWRDQLRPQKTTEGLPKDAAERIRELESELTKTQRERDIFKKALAILGRNDL